MNQGLKIIVRGNNSKARAGARSFDVCLARWTAVLVLALLAAAGAWAQDEHKRKVPVLDKLSTSGPGQQAFSGSVQSVDLKSAVLAVRSTRGDADEYFPLKKNVRVATADGRSLTLDGVKLNWNVLVYFEQKDDRRTIKEIIVLGPPSAQPPKSPPVPPS